MSKRLTPGQWSELSHKCSQRGMSIKAFCAMHKVSTASYYNNRRYGTAPDVGFVELVPEATEQGMPFCTIRFEGGASMDIYPTLSTEVIKSLIRC